MVAALVVSGLVGRRAGAEDVSAPVILQDFEQTYKTIESRLPDIFAAGYGTIYTPPPGRSDQGNFSVGYDQYDRFDLGAPGKPTIYGTETGLKKLVTETHKMGGTYAIDFVMNHNGYSDYGTVDGNGVRFAPDYNNPAALHGGGYPGFALPLLRSTGQGPDNGGNIDGDFNSPYDYGVQQLRLAGLIDIAQEHNYRFIRTPVVAGDPRNLPAGTATVFGRRANVPDPNNARFYPDKSLNPILVYDPATNVSNIAIYPFNNANPLQGTPVEENAMGLIMRNAQWLVQTVGVDMFRLDAAKHVTPFTLDYFDRAVYRSSFRTLLNGAQEQVFSFSEAYDGSAAYLQGHVKKTPFVYGGPNNNQLQNEGTVHANRDALDFKLFFAMQANLSSNGFANNWDNIRSAALDVNDDGYHNGSQGVTFVSSADNGPPALGNVAYAYTLMMPGNTIVYYNGKEFGNDRSFPQDGRGDALGGTYGDAIPELVNLRNRYGRGNYIERLTESKNFAFERESSALVLLNSEPYSGGYDSRTIPTSFAPGTRLLEQTGNAADSNSDPFNDIPEVLTVNGDGSVNVRFLHNVKPGYSSPDNGGFTGNGYLIYGLPTPQGSLSLTNVAQVLPGHTPDSATSTNLPYDNGVSRLHDISVVTGNSFQVKLDTLKVNLLGLAEFRDRDADGDNAMLKIDGGLDVNGSGAVDITQPGSVAYGFEQFVTVRSPGYFNANGNGQYAQTIDATQLSEGMHYITAIAFRRRDSGPAVYTDWKQSIYVDRLPPNSAAISFAADQTGVNENRQLRVKSLDLTADNVHVLLDLPAGLTSAQVLGLVNGGTQGERLDRDIWQKYLTGVSSGNHVATVVTYEITGNYNIQRFSAGQLPGLTVSSSIGRGIGDLNVDGFINATDVNQLSTVVISNNQQFNPAGDVNADGQIDLADTFLMGPVLNAAAVDNNTWNAFNGFINSGFVTSGTYTVNGAHNVYEVTAGTTNLTAGSSLIATYLRGSALSVGAGGIAALRANSTAGAGASKLSSVNLAGATDAWTAKLDLNNNSLILQSTAANRAADLARTVNQLKNGAIITSFAATDASGGAHALGVILNDNGSGGAIYPNFDGLSANANAVLIKYTLLGDTNLDGKVDVTDLGNVSSAYGAGGAPDWRRGDFNYDGAVSVSDLGDLASNYGLALGGGTIDPGSPPTMLSVDTAELAVALAPNASPASAVAVPEPASAALLTVAVVGLLARSGRRRNPQACSLLT